MFIHPSAVVEDNVEIGEGSSLWHLVLARKNCRIGSNCVLGRGVFIDAGVQIGNNVKIQNYVSVYEGVTLDDGVFVGPNAVFTNDKVPRAINADGTLKSAADWIVSETHVGYGAAIGANATIVCGVKIGKWAMIAAGAIVTKDVPDYGLIVGAPGKLVGYVTPEGERVDSPPTE